MNNLKSSNMYSIVKKVVVAVAVIFGLSMHSATAQRAKIEMVRVRGGVFTMGCTAEPSSSCNNDERPAHRVTLRNFNMGKYPVTQAQWEAVMGSNPSAVKGSNLPVTDVNWNDVQEFISKLNAQTGKRYRLPTEAEWEYAARGGNKSKGYKYSGSNNVDNVGWYRVNSERKVSPVGKKKANELGIYDMSGNVMEWCSDWAGAYTATAKTNPAGPPPGSGERILRGGSWDTLETLLEVSHRYSMRPDTRHSTFGFRLVLP